MTFEQAVDFITERLDVPAPELRATRDKVRKRVSYGLGNGSLPRLDVQTLDVDRDELILWARKKWAGKFNNLSTFIRIHIGDAVVLGDKADALHFPSSLAECHRLIRKLENQNRMLTMRESQQAAEIARLRPLAEQYQRNRAKNRRSAKKPRSK